MTAVLAAGCSKPAPVRADPQAVAASSGHSSGGLPAAQPRKVRRPGARRPSIAPHRDSSPAPSWLASVRADAAFVGAVEVLRLKSRDGTIGSRKNRVIWTDALVRPWQVIRDQRQAAPSTFNIVLLGGKIGDRTFATSHAPRFAVGDRLVVAVKLTDRGLRLVGGRGGFIRVVDGRPVTADGLAVVGLSEHGWQGRRPPRDEPPVLVEANGDSLPVRRVEPNVADSNPDWTLQRALEALTDAIARPAPP